MRPAINVHTGRSSLRGDLGTPASRIVSRSAFSDLQTGAPATMVNRTHRVIRERARTMQANRSRLRGLMLPLTLCSALLILFYVALWSVMDQYETFSPETPTDSHRMFMLLIWFLPVSAAAGALVWYHRSRIQCGRDMSR
ncbi:MAG TPA: hypothetical protein VGC07_01240 [Granulicella sp.]